MGYTWVACLEKSGLGFMKLRRWYSICSAHQGRVDNCDLCDCGRWSFEPYRLFSGFMWKKAPKFWRWWQNRRWKKRHWLKSFRSYKTGKRVTPFPNLKA